VTYCVMLIDLHESMYILSLNAAVPLKYSHDLTLRRLTRIRASPCNKKGYWLVAPVRSCAFLRSKSGAFLNWLDIGGELNHSMRS
jgi:hypothetical protein